MSYVVWMTDTFLSGWGKAEGKRNVYAIWCDTREQVVQIEKAALARDEMQRIHVGFKLPYWKESEVLVTEKKFHELGPTWTGELGERVGGS
jgi:hypothetical protein